MNGILLIRKQEYCSRLSYTKRILHIRGDLKILDDTNVCASTQVALLALFLSVLSKLRMN